MSEHKALRVLVVEDEVMIALTVAQILEDHGFAVVIAHDGRQALELARAEPPDAVVTDHMMPRMSGQDLAAALRADPALAAVPVVLTSAVPPENLGDVFDQVFTKPYEISDLPGVLRKLISGRS